MSAPEILLTEEQRLEFTQISQNISEYDIAQYYTFSEYDIEIINCHRRDYNRLGFAVQLGVLRHIGWPLSNIDIIPEEVLEYIAEQIKVDPKEFTFYAQRENTRRDHLDEIRDLYGYKSFTEEHSQYLLQILMSYAMENDNVINLIKIAIEALRKKKIVLPGITTIEKIVSEVRIKADETVITLINERLTDKQRYNLDILLHAQSEDSKTKLGWLREYPGNPSPKAFTSIIE